MSRTTYELISGVKARRTLPLLSACATVLMFFDRDSTTAYCREAFGLLSSVAVVQRSVSPVPLIPEIEIKPDAPGIGEVVSDGTVFASARASSALLPRPFGFICVILRPVVESTLDT